MSEIQVNKIKPYSGGHVFVEGDISSSGTIMASEYIVQSVTQSILTMSGSSQFGNSADDTHVFSGDISASHNMIVSGVISGSSISSSRIGRVNELHMTKGGTIYFDKADENNFLWYSSDDLYYYSGSTQLFQINANKQYVEIRGDLRMLPGGMTGGARSNGDITASSISASGHISASQFVGQFTGSFNGDGTDLTGVSSISATDDIVTTGDITCSALTASANVNSPTGSFVWVTNQNPVDSINGNVNILADDLQLWDNRGVNFHYGTLTSTTAGESANRFIITTPVMTQSIELRTASPSGNNRAVMDGYTGAWKFSSHITASGTISSSENIQSKYMQARTLYLDDIFNDGGVPTANDNPVVTTYGENGSINIIGNDDHNTTISGSVIRVGTTGITYYNSAKRAIFNQHSNSAILSGGVIIWNGAITASGAVSASNLILNSEQSSTPVMTLSCSGSASFGPYVRVKNEVNQHPAILELTSNTVDYEIKQAGGVTTLSNSSAIGNITHKIGGSNRHKITGNSNYFDTHVTASGNISGSGNVHGHVYQTHTQTIAAAGSNQGTATDVNANAGTVFVSTDSAAKGVVLPQTAGIPAGTTFTLYNTSAEELKVYPKSGDRIFPLADDAPATLPDNAAMTLTVFSDDGWQGFIGTVIS